MKSGVYVIDFGENMIKIGRSSNISKRLQQYKGYRCEIPKQFMLIYTEKHKYLEQQLHNFAELHAKRRERLEIFQCQDKEIFISKLNQHILKHYVKEYLYIEYGENEKLKNQIIEFNEADFLGHKKDINIEKDHLNQYFESHKYVKRN